jgi:hypothetical protein
MSGEGDMSHGKGLDDKGDTRATTSETSSGKRRRTLTEKGKHLLLAQLKGKRQTLVAQITTKSNEINTLFESYGNIDVVRKDLIEWDVIHNKFIEAHCQYYSQLSEELKGIDNSGWFEPKEIKCWEFKLRAEQWLLQAAQYIDQKRVDEAVGPNDSVSQASSRRSSRSRFSLRSHASSISSARVREEAKRAELLARSALLKQKQALDDEELCVSRMKEEFQLQSEMAISDARVKVYERFEEESVGQRQSLVGGDKRSEQNLNKDAVLSSHRRS